MGKNFTHGLVVNTAEQAKIKRARGLALGVGVLGVAALATVVAPTGAGAESAPTSVTGLEYSTVLDYFAKHLGTEDLSAVSLTKYTDGSAVADGTSLTTTGDTDTLDALYKAELVDGASTYFYIKGTKEVVIVNNVTVKEGATDNKFTEAFNNNGSQDVEALVSEDGDLYILEKQKVTSKPASIWVNTADGSSDVYSYVTGALNSTEYEYSVDSLYINETSLNKLISNDKTLQSWTGGFSVDSVVTLKTDDNGNVKEDKVISNTTGGYSVLLEGSSGELEDKLIQVNIKNGSETAQVYMQVTGDIADGMLKPLHHTSLEGVLADENSITLGSVDTIELSEASDFYVHGKNIVAATSYASGDTDSAENQVNLKTKVIADNTKQINYKHTLTVSTDVEEGDVSFKFSKLGATEKEEIDLNSGGTPDEENVGETGDISGTGAVVATLAENGTHAFVTSGKGVVGANATIDVFVPFDGLTNPTLKGTSTTEMKWATNGDTKGILITGYPYSADLTHIAIQAELKGVKVELPVYVDVLSDTLKTELNATITAATAGGNLLTAGNGALAYSFADFNSSISEPTPTDVTEVKDSIQKASTELSKFEGVVKKAQTKVDVYDFIQDVKALASSTEEDALETLTAKYGLPELNQHGLDGTTASLFYDKVADYTKNKEENIAKFAEIYKVMADLDLLMAELNQDSSDALTATLENSSFFKGLARTDLVHKLITNVQDVYQTLLPITTEVHPTERNVANLLNRISGLKSSTGEAYADLVGVAELAKAAMDSQNFDKLTDAQNYNNNKVVTEIGEKYSGVQIVDLYVSLYNEYTEGKEIPTAPPVEGGEPKPDTDKEPVESVIDEHIIDVDGYKSSTIIYRSLPAKGETVKYFIKNIDVNYEKGQELTFKIGSVKAKAAVWNEKEEAWEVDFVFKNNVKEGVQTVNLEVKNERGRSLEKVTYKQYMLDAEDANKINALLYGMEADKDKKLTNAEKTLVERYAKLLTYEDIEDVNLSDVVSVIKDLLSVKYDSDAVDTAVDELKLFVVQVAVEIDLEEDEDATLLTAEELAEIFDLSKPAQYKDIPADILQLFLEMGAIEGDTTDKSADYDINEDTVEEVLKLMLRTVEMLKNPSASTAKSLDKLIEDYEDYPFIDELIAYYELVLAIVGSKDAEYDLEDAIAEVEDLEESSLRDSFLALADIDALMKELEEGKISYATSKERVELLEGLTTVEGVVSENGIYADIATRLLAYKKANGESIVQAETSNGVTNLTVDGDFETMLKIALNEKDIEKAIAENVTKIVIASNDGVKTELDATKLNLPALKEELGAFSLEATFEKTASGALSFGLTAKQSVETGTAKTKDITDLGKMTKIYVDAKHLNVGAKERLYRVVKDSKGAIISKVPVLGKSVKGVNGEVIGYEFFTQYTGEFTLDASTQTIGDISSYANAEGMQDFVDRGILKTNNGNFSPSSGMSIDDVTEALLVAFGTTANDKERMQTIVGSDIPTFLQSTLGTSAGGEINREQAAVLLVKVLEQNIDQNSGNTQASSVKAVLANNSSLPNYGDVETINTKAASAASKLQQLGIMTGRDGNFHASEKLTKSQFSKVLRLTLQKLGLISTDITS